MIKLNESNTRVFDPRIQPCEVDVTNMIIVKKKLTQSEANAKAKQTYEKYKTANTKVEYQSDTNDTQDPLITESPDTQPEVKKPRVFDSSIQPCVVDVTNMTIIKGNKYTVTIPEPVKNVDTVTRSEPKKNVDTVTKSVSVKNGDTVTKPKPKPINPVPMKNGCLDHNYPIFSHISQMSSATVKACIWYSGDQSLEHQNPEAKLAKICRQARPNSPLKHLNSLESTYMKVGVKRHNEVVEKFRKKSRLSHLIHQSIGQTNREKVEVYIEKQDPKPKPVKKTDTETRSEPMKSVEHPIHHYIGLMSSEMVEACIWYSGDKSLEHHNPEAKLEEICLQARPNSPFKHLLSLQTKHKNVGARRHKQKVEKLRMKSSKQEETTDPEPVNSPKADSVPKHSDKIIVQNQSIIEESEEKQEPKTDIVPQRIDEIISQNQSIVDDKVFMWKGKRVKGKNCPTCTKSIHPASYSKHVKDCLQTADLKTSDFTGPLD